MKHIFIRSILSLCFLAMGNPLLAAETRTGPLVKIETAIYFLTTDGSDVLVPPGTYQLEAAEEWLRLVPGERRDALLLEAVLFQHEENLETAKALSQPREADEYRIVLLLPEGHGFEAIGSVSGVRSRAVRRPLTSRARTQPKQASPSFTQSKKRTVIKKSKPLTKSPTQPNDPLNQRMQNLEHLVSTLQATINVLQNRISKIESTVQVDNAGNMTITLAGKFKVNATIVDINAGSIKANAGLSKFSGTLQSDTVITDSVVSKTYTPGAGNIW
jgi:hypothetical protein